MRKIQDLTPLLLIAALAATGAAQKPVESQGPTLDFYVTGPDGQTPANLTPADLTLKVGGRERAIRSLERIAPRDPKAPPFTITGQPAAGTPRNVILVVDEATLFGLEPIVKEAVTKLLASLAPADLVAFISTRLNGLRTNLTPRREVVTGAIDALVTGPGRLWTCQKDMMAFLEPIATSAPPGRSTTLAVISRGSNTGASALGETESGPCAPRSRDMRALEETISAAQINLHLFTVDDLKRSWGFDTVAGNTGGGSSLLTWSNSDALARAIRDTAHYYRATLADDGRPAGRPQKIELRAGRPDLKILTSPTIR